MPTKKRSNKRAEKREERIFSRQVLRAQFVSMFWSAIESRKQRGPYKLAELAKETDTSKPAVSRWFGGVDRPNWQVDTIADIADALGLQIILRAKDKATGEIHTPHGIETSQSPTQVWVVPAIMRKHVGGNPAKYSTAVTDEAPNPLAERILA